MKRETVAGLMFATVLSTAACVGPEEDTAYTLEGVVTAVDQDHIEIGDITVLTPNESAEPRLADGRDEIDDNYSDASCFNHETSDVLDVALDAGRITVGSHVIVGAALGDSYYNCVVPGRTGSGFGQRSLLQSLEVVD